MKKISVVLSACLLVSGLAVAGVAEAHPRDAMRPIKAGPIVRGQTTMADLRSWFGAPTRRTVVRVGCERVIRARWGRKLTVYVPTADRRVQAIFVKARRIRSSEHGPLAMHSRKGLRVGDPQRKLRRLYPRARPETHRGHTHYRLATGRYGAYLMAKVVDRRVVQLEAWPYEFC